MQEYKWTKAWYCENHRPYHRCLTCSALYTCVICANPGTCTNCRTPWECYTCGKLSYDPVTNNVQYTYEVATANMGQGIVQRVADGTAEGGGGGEGEGGEGGEGGESTAKNTGPMNDAERLRRTEYRIKASRYEMTKHVYALPHIRGRDRQFIVRNIDFVNPPSARHAPQTKQ
ncbi:hypothetical protein F5Y13DRAFT_164570 [Hypoxylon sp. FL1857]|nr:hypothetical protein F5Y13DRAFT_164570 [Hypoxylon sp. FL1857]